MLHEGKTDTDIVLVAGFAWVGIRANNLSAGRLVMTRPFGWLVLSLLLGPAGLAMAQSCPSGIPSAGNPMCLPPGAAGSPYNSSSAPPSSEPSMHWKKTWGAIAFSSTGEVGATTAQPSRRKAQKEALERCVHWGGTDCSIQLAYQNQCAAVAWPSVPGVRSAVVSAGSVEEASGKALSLCNKDGGACKIVYSDCTPPVLVYD
jgi:hypothetical protein